MVPYAVRYCGHKHNFGGNQPANLVTLEARHLLASSTAQGTLCDLTTMHRAPSNLTHVALSCMLGPVCQVSMMLGVRWRGACQATDDCHCQPTIQNRIKHIISSICKHSTQALWRNEASMT
jgi:hypothetical protein